MFYKSKGCVQTTQPFFYSCVEIKFYEGIYRIFELKQAFGKVGKIIKKQDFRAWRGLFRFANAIFTVAYMSFSVQNQGLPDIHHLFA